MYLREMGSVELLSREGEIAIAKRIEAGRNTMIAGLCESPLTFQAITIWHDELLSEDILLRDVIDLETTFGNQMDEDGDVKKPVVDTRQMSPTAPPRRPSPELDADGNPIANDDDDDDDEQANMSLAAMEAALKPQVLDHAGAIAMTTRSCRNAGQPDFGDAERRWQLSAKEGKETYQKLRARSLNW